MKRFVRMGIDVGGTHTNCLLYTSDAADEEDSVDLGGRRIIKKKKRYQNTWIERHKNKKKKKKKTKR